MTKPTDNPLDLIHQVGLSHRADQLLPLFQPTIAATSQQVEFEREIPLGASKLGGRPDAPPDFAWPYYYKRPLEFVAQINFAETAPYDEQNLLPTSGRLLCFYDLEGPNIDNDVLDHDWFRVIYDTSDMPERIDYPETAEAEFRPCVLNFSIKLTLPPLFSKPLADIQIEDEQPTNILPQATDIDAYWDLLDLTSQSDSNHQLLGWPYQISGDVFIVAERDASNMPSSEPLDTFYVRHGAAIDEWLLLLQIDSDNKANMMWGDNGTLYWCIRRDDLRHRLFDRVIVVKQCH